MVQPPSWCELTVHKKVFSDRDPVIGGPVRRETWVIESIGELGKHEEEGKPCISLGGKYVTREGFLYLILDPWCVPVLSDVNRSSWVNL